LSLSWPAPPWPGLLGYDHVSNNVADRLTLCRRIWNPARHCTGCRPPTSPTIPWPTRADVGQLPAQSGAQPMTELIAARHLARTQPGRPWREASLTGGTSLMARGTSCGYPRRGQIGLRRCRSRYRQESLAVLRRSVTRIFAGETAGSPGPTATISEAGHVCLAGRTADGRGGAAVQAPTGS